MADLDSATIETIARLVRKGCEYTVGNVNPEAASEGYRLLLSYPADLKVEDITDRVLAALPNPRFRKGTVTLTGLASFEDFVNRMQEPHSVLFASKEQMTLTCVFDYHDPVNKPALLKLEGPKKPDEDKPEPEWVEIIDPIEPTLRWGRYRALFAFPQSRQWLTWKAANKKAMSQAELAAFIEDNINDILPPGAMLADASGGLVKQLGLKLGTPETLLAVSRGLSLRADEQFKNVVNLNTGETHVIYEQTHAPTDGVGDIKVPTAFLIAIPVFEGDAPFQILVRLKYRKAQSAISWHFDLYNIDLTFEHAFKESCTRVRDATGLPLFYGAPET